MKILVVDDTPAELKLIRIYLQQAGHEVLTAADGLAALNVYYHERPELILSDVVMPVLNGYEFARKIREASPGNWIPIIFLSAMVSEDDLALGIQSGGDDYLTKPVNRTILLAKIHAMERIVATRQHLLTVMAELAEANRQLHQMINRDCLTQVANRQCFDATLMREWDEAARYRRALSLMLLDIDYFKAYNHLYGHHQGDQCLKEIAHELRNGIHRPCDLLARYSSDTFAAILPDTDYNGASTLAEYLREAIANRALPHEQSPHHKVTLSIGLATAIAAPLTTANHLMKCADEALYQAKQQGHNRVVALEITQ